MFKKASLLTIVSLLFLSIPFFAYSSKEKQEGRYVKIEKNVQSVEEELVRHKSENIETHYKHEQDINSLKDQLLHLHRKKTSEYILLAIAFVSVFISFIALFKEDIQNHYCPNV